MKSKPEELLRPYGEVKNLPLHLAVQRQKPDEPQCRETSRGQFALWNQQEEIGLWQDPYDDFNAKIVQILLEAYTIATMVRNKNGDLPVHLAIQCRKPPSVINALYEAFPEALDCKGNTPLHCVAMLDLPYRYKLLGYVFDQDEDSDAAMDRYEYHYGPLLYCCEVDSQWISDLVKRDSAALQARNQMGSLPLHVALKSGKSWSSGIEVMFGEGR